MKIMDGRRGGRAVLTLLSQSLWQYRWNADNSGTLWRAVRGNVDRAIYKDGVLESSVFVYCLKSIYKSRIKKGRIKPRALAPEIWKKWPQGLLKLKRIGYYLRASMIY
jgi:hypothetical protein